MTEWNAAEYAQRSALQAAMAAEVLALLDLSGSERILDIGCGDGRITLEIAARLPHGTVLGVDASHEMIGFAEGRLKSAPQANARFAVEDARSLPCHQEFDLVVSFNALHWVPEQTLALRSIHRALRPAGGAQLRLVPTGERKSLESVIEETRLSERWAGYFAGFHDPYLRLTQEQYVRLAEENGFEVLHVQSAAKAWDFQSRSTFAAFGLVTFAAWTKRLPESERPAFVSDVLDRYAPVAADQPGQENMFRFYQMDIALRRT